MQKLSKRLQAVARFVTCGSLVADIGTDHGYLPVYLVQSGRCPGALAMDIRQGPLQRAREHIAANGLEALIKTRLSDGLEQLGADEAQSVVIAGMGGLTITGILGAAGELLSHIRELVLEPQSDIGKVRKFLRLHGMYTDMEELVLEDGKFYPVLHVVKRDWPSALREGPVMDVLRKKMPEPDRLEELVDQYGPCLIGESHPVLGQLLERDRDLKQEILRSLAESASESSKKRRQELERQLTDIRILRETLERV